MHALVDFSGAGRRDLFMLNWAARGDLLYRRIQKGKPVKPGPPGEVRVTRDPASGRTVVAWPYDWGAARYEVWRSGRRIGVGRLMRFVDTNAVPGSTYRALPDSNRRPPPYHERLRQSVATRGNGFRLSEPFSAHSHLRPVATSCDRWAP